MSRLRNTIILAQKTVAQYRVIEPVTIAELKDMSTYELKELVAELACQLVDIQAWAINKYHIGCEDWETSKKIHLDLKMALKLIQKVSRPPK